MEQKNELLETYMSVTRAFRKPHGKKHGSCKGHKHDDSTVLINLSMDQNDGCCNKSDHSKCCGNKNEEGCCGHDKHGKHDGCCNHDKHHGHDDKSSKKGEFSFERRRCLIKIYENPKITQSELATLLEISLPSVNEMVNKLEAKGFVVKNKDENDNRISRVEVTEQGISKVKQHMKQESDFGSNLTEDEKETFIRLCNKIKEGL